MVSTILLYHFAVVVFRLKRTRFILDGQARCRLHFERKKCLMLQTLQDFNRYTLTRFRKYWVPCINNMLNQLKVLFFPIFGLTIHAINQDWPCSLHIIYCTSIASSLESFTIKKMISGSDGRKVSAIKVWIFFLSIYLRFWFFFCCILLLGF